MPVWLRAFAFVVAVPGTVAGLLPWYIAGSPPLYSSGRSPLQASGLALVLIGAAILLWCVTDFVRRGRGTPAPYDPPVMLVTSGLYRFTRNPMYVGVVTTIVGEATWFGSSAAVIYAVVVALAFHARVALVEEPRLTKLFGAAYADYCAYVPRWLPRVRRASAQQ